MSDIIDFDIQLQRVFEHGDVQQHGKTSKQSSDNVTMTAYEYSKADQILYLGLSNGKLCYYKSKNIEQKSIFGKGKDPQREPIESVNGHKGEIRKIIYAQVNEGAREVLITASSDRTIKLWEPKPDKNSKSNPCFQTIVGHEGSILDMAYVPRVDQLITSSTDKTMRIWKIDTARELLAYPWFEINQKVQDFTSINQQLDVDVWINCLAVNDSSNEKSLGFYAGDSEGSLLWFNKGGNSLKREGCQFEFG